MATTCASLFVLQRRDRPRDASVVNANAPDPATTTTLIVIGIFYVKYDEMNEMLQVGVRKDVLGPEILLPMGLVKLRN